MASNLKLGALLFLALWVDLICAHREYAVGIPNGVRIPCPPDVDCGGAGYCFAAGHERCLSSETTEFGDDVEDGWTSSACRADSDNDGWTNGDELGDPCCIWRRGETPTFMEGLSHPGSSVSKPIRSSCSSNEQVLQPPLALKVVETTDTKVALEWGFPEESCVCWNTIVVEQSSEIIQTIPFAHNLPNSMHLNQFVICNLSPATTYQISVSASNLVKKVSAPASISVTTLGSSSNSDHLSCSTGFDEFPTISTEPISHSEILPFAWESVSGALFFIFFLILFTWLELFQKDPFSSARNKLRHYRPISSFKFLTLASIAAILSLIVQEAIVIISKTRFINAFDYNPVFNDKNLVGRLFAFISLPALFLLLLPISKHSIFHLLIGIPLDSAVKWHTYIASFASICMIIHGSLFLERLSNSPLGVKVAFGSEYPYSILPGFVAWIMIIIGWTTSVIEPIRRRYWDLWMSYHSLLIIALLLLMLHAKATIPYLIFGLVFYGVDKIFYVATLLYFPSKISYIKTIEDVNGDYVLVKMKRKNILSKMNPYSPGKIVHLGVRQIGFFSHPFSIVDSVPIKEDETEITLLSKVVRSNYAKRKTWTEKYLELVKLGKLKAGDQVTFYGPYSTSTVQFINYERIVLFAAGSGITPMIYIMSYVLKHKSSKLNHVTLVWTTRDAKVVDALLSHISPPPGTEKDLEIEVKLYLTGESDCNSFEHHQSITLKVNLGRPKIDEIFEEIESKVRSSNEKIALAVCGAENFTDEVVRRASKQPRNSSEQQCEFHLHREGFAL